MRHRVDPLANPGPLLDRVYAYVAYRIGAGAAAEDVTAEVLERAIRYRDSYDATRGDPVSWAIGIARRRIQDLQAERTVERLEDRDETSGPGFAEAVHGRIDLERALSTLDDRDRELVALRYGADLGAADIGRLLDLTPGAVRVALHRALDRLRTALADPL